jgi:hypothetical protein
VIVFSFRPCGAVIGLGRLDRLGGFSLTFTGQPRAPSVLFAANIRLKSPVITKTFFIAKILCTYTMNYLRQEKSIRDHEATVDRIWPGWAQFVRFAREDPPNGTG